jgi:hypothetical protein
MACPVCHQIILSQTPVQNEKRAGFKRGNIVVCSRCANVLKVGDDAFIRMNPEQIGKLDQVSRDVIKTIQDAVKGQHGQKTS